VANQPNLKGMALIPTAIGRVTDVESAELLYFELHHRSKDGLKDNVIYHLPDRQIAAEKRLEFQQISAAAMTQDQNTPSEKQIADSAGLISSAPLLSQTNFLTGEFLQVEYVQTESRRWRIHYRPLMGEEVSIVEIDDLPDLVIDAGIHSFVLQHWDALLADEAVAFNYLLPERQKIYRFDLRRMDCEKSAKQVCLVAAPHSWWDSLFIDGFRLKYNRETQMLASFRGQSMLKSSSEEYERVFIEYSYPPPRAVNQQ